MVRYFAQGFIPAIVAQEVLVRKQGLIKLGWFPIIVISVCLAFSAIYELIEWWVAVLYGGVSLTFLGTQGDVWDTQSDMVLAMIGVICALLALSRVHDKQALALNQANKIQQARRREH